MAIASQYVRGRAGRARATTLSGIAIVTTYSAVPNPEIEATPSVEQYTGATTETISESVSVTVT